MVNESRALTNRGSEVGRTPEEIELSTGGARLTKQAIATIAEQMELAEDLVNRLMKFDIDYGITPGTQGPGLWDAGAAKVIRAFHSHAEHKILFHEETDDVISWTIEAQLVSTAGEIVGNGLGNASTREQKFGKRWVSKEEAERLGYTEEDIGELKTKLSQNGQTALFHIHNPDVGDLTHTLLVIASKRAEIDAAKSLPGVASALRAKFDPKAGVATTVPKEDINLPVFWSMMKGSDLTEDDVHRILQVKSVKDWLAKGKSLREAATFILRGAVKQIRSTKAPQQKAPQVEKKPAELTKEDIPDLDTLVAMCEKYWHVPEAVVFTTLGYTDRQNFIDAAVQTAFEAWQALLELQTS